MGQTWRVREAIWWAADYLWAAAVWGSTAWAPADPSRYTTGEKGPVVVLPGVYESWQFARPLINFLHRNGYPVHVVPELGSNRGPIATGARNLLEMLKRHDLKDVVLVAHSKGGLIGKVALRHDCEHRINSMISIATPYHSSSRIKLLPLPALRELQDLGDLGEPDPINSRIISLAPEFDEHVPEGSVLPGARNITLPVQGHFFPLGDSVTRAQILQAIEQVRPSEPAPDRTGTGSTAAV